jgi:DNA polymerase III subunit epsilon
VGVTVRESDTLLTTRAREFLAAGPAGSRELMAHICQMPRMPPRIAERMAAALFRGNLEVVRDGDGRWRLSAEPVQDESIAESTLLGISRGENPPLSALRYAVVDVETTGTRAYGGDRITELAVIHVDRAAGQRAAAQTTALDTLLNPERAIPPGVTRLTSITSDMVRHRPCFGDVSAQVLAALEDRVFVGHNARFDWRFLRMEIERATGRSLTGPRLCTVKLARKLLPQLRRRSLDQLAWHYGVEIVGRHRAGGDARATATVFIRLLGEARSGGCDGWSDLSALLGAPAPARPRRPSAMPRPVEDAYE